MVSAASEQRSPDQLRQVGEDALAVALDRRGLAVQERFGLADLAAERLDDRLVAEADAERRRMFGPSRLDQLDRDARVLRTPGAGGDDEVRRRECSGLVGRDRVVPEDANLEALFSSKRWTRLAG